MDFYDFAWKEDYSEIFNDCLRRVPSCCLFHNDQVDRTQVEKLALYLGETDTESGFVISSILGATCTCNDYEYCLPYELSEFKSNMPYEDVQKEEERLVLYFANVCNKMKDKENTDEICEFFHELIQQWYKWRDPAVVEVFRVLKMLTFKPYRDYIQMQIPPHLLKDFFSESFANDIKSYNCDVCVHTDEGLALDNTVYFMVQAPSFQYFLNLQNYLKWKFQDIQKVESEESEETESEEDCEEDNVSQDNQENSNWDSQNVDTSSVQLEPEPSTSAEGSMQTEHQPTEGMSESTNGANENLPKESNPINAEESQQIDNSSVEMESDEQSQRIDSVQNSDNSTQNPFSDNTQNPNLSLQITFLSGLPTIGEILAPQIPELQSPKSPQVNLTLAEVSSGFIFHL